MYNRKVNNKSAARLFILTIIVIFTIFSSGSVVLANDSSSVEMLRQTSQAFVDIAEKASLAVVGIQAERTITQKSRGGNRRDYDFSNPFEDDFFDFFFRRSPRGHNYPQPKTRQTAQGTGFIISSDGYILTNNHLVNEADKVTVKLTENKEFEAKIVGTDPASDVAVVKIEADNLAYLEMADSDKLKVGEWVIAIGNPFGLSHTVTAGIVSAKGRSINLTEYDDFIQTDAAINPGNSGGPLLNLDGKVIGINTAIVSRSGGNMGIGMAIPVNMAKYVYQQLVDEGKVVRGFLGVTLSDVDEDMAEYFELKGVKGVILPEVVPDSAAEKAGIKRGDIIVEFDGTAVESADSLRKRVAMLKPGTKVEIVVLRDGKRKTVTAVLDERPKREGLASGKSETLEAIGISVQNLTDELARRFGYEGMEGVIVTKVEAGSLANRAGINPGTLIIEVNKKPVTSAKQFNKVIKEAKKDGNVLLYLYNGKYRRYILLTLSQKE